MFVTVGYEWQIHSHIKCYQSLDGVYAPIRLIGCCISPLGYTRQDLSVQGVHQSCWYMSIMHHSWHVDIFHPGYLWCLTDIFHRWRRWMFIDFQKGTNVHQYRILLQHLGWYLPHALCWRCVCCAIKVLGLYLWWVTYARLLVTRYGKTWVHDMGSNPNYWWVFPSQECMMHP